MQRRVDYRSAGKFVHKLLKHEIFERLKAFRRFWFAVVDRMGPLGYYSQFGEDRILSEDISPQELADGIYIDVGANHPTRISNTYRFYRLGSRGVLIEPNEVFSRLYQRFRSRDIHLKVGIAAKPAILPFFDHGSTSVSGFVESEVASSAAGYLPVLPLDELLPIVGPTPIYLLSIDVEGMDDQVLLSGAQLLTRVSRVVIEYGDRFEVIDTFLANNGFERFSQNSTNGIYKRIRNAESAGGEPCPC